jgi:sugar phosphate isomerase/epimerase
VRLGTPGAPQLTYCTNIHPGETWPEVRTVLERSLPVVRAAVAPSEPFGVGLRLAAAAADALSAPAELAALRELLRQRDLYVFTINGFPYGAFHGTRVKEAVYTPDWRSPERGRYSAVLAELLAALLPENCAYGSVSTIPGAFRPRAASPDAFDAIAEGLLSHVATLVALEERTGRCVRLALEPEPWCVVERVADTIAFFDAHLFSPGAARRLASLTGRSEAACGAALRRHLGVCFDACHMAVEFEDPADALARFAAAGIDLVKVQISAGMVARFTGADDASVRAALAAFADDVYLHQVVERGPGGLRRWVDLPQALAADAAGAGPREWRVHFHVPLFRRSLGMLASTQAWVAALLLALRRDAYAGHLEVETYTWDVLPAEHRGEPVETAIARELAWVLEQLAS